MGPPAGLIGHRPNREASRLGGSGVCEHCRWVAAFVTNRDRFSGLARLDPGPTHALLRALLATPGCPRSWGPRRALLALPSHTLQQDLGRCSHPHSPPVPPFHPEHKGDGRGGRSVSPFSGRIRSAKPRASEGLRQSPRVGFKHPGPIERSTLQATERRPNSKLSLIGVCILSHPDGES